MRGVLVADEDVPFPGQGELVVSKEPQLLAEDLVLPFPQLI